MPFSFPSSPTVNQTSVQNGRVYRWTGSAWEILVSTAQSSVVSLGGLTGTLQIVAGSNVTVTTAANSIVISSAQSTQTAAAPNLLAWTTIRPAGALANYSPGTATIVRVNSTTTVSLTGISECSKQSPVRVINVSTNSLTLVHESTMSSSQNRLLIDTGTNRALDENDQAEFLYDPVSMRWRVTPCCGGAST
jgi:hypothetical protein